MSRFAFIWLGLPGYAAMAVPVAGIIAGVATFVVLTEIVHVYTGWSLARFIRKRGEGIHHLSISVRDLGKAVDRLSREGGRVIETSSYYCAQEGGALREVFLHPKDCSGVLFHIVEER